MRTSKAAPSSTSALTWDARPTSATVRSRLQDFFPGQSSRTAKLRSGFNKPGPSTSTTFSSHAGESWDSPILVAEASADPTIATASTAVTPTFQWVRGELIGKGSYGRVYLAFNATTGEIMAVKQVETPQTPSDQADSKQVEVVAALKFESDTLKELEHPHIVQYLGFEETPASISIFLEYVPGGSIGSCLARHGRFDEAVTKSFTAQILNGLEYLHSEGIIHRDLKADNILVEQSGICKISDFGISKRAEDIAGRAFTQMKGTIYWMAPEVVDSRKMGYDFKADIWSIGCVVLEMWTGNRPWHGQDTIPVMLKLFKNQEAPSLPQDVVLSAAGSDFRNKCFAINPAERPSAAELQKHPYLVLPADWMFKVSDIERSPTRPLSGRRSKPHTARTINDACETRTIRPSHRSRLSDGSATEVLPQSRRRHQQYPSSPPRIPLPDPPSNDAPPIVFITPPSSPVRATPPGSTTHSPASSESARTSASQRLKSYYVVNPDSDPESDDNRASSSRNKSRTRPYVYNPPPLPGASRTGPYSAAASPPERTSHATLKTRKSMASLRRMSGKKSPQEKTASMSMQDLALRLKTSTPQMRTRSHHGRMSSLDDMAYSDSDSDSNAGTLWNKPPVDVVRKPGLSTSTSPQSGGSPAKVSYRLSIIEKKRDSTWAPRPVVQDVYEHMHDFFPQHDLDKPLITSGNSVARATQEATSPNLEGKKTIRMVAEEEVRNMADPVGIGRRRTKLWGSRVEEVTSVP